MFRWLCVAALLLPVLSAHVACTSNANVTVTLAKSSSPLFNPFMGTMSLRKVRVTIDGTAPDDDASIDLADAELTRETVVFSNIPPSGKITVRAYGYDDIGNLVAFGGADGVDVAGDVSVTIPFHRNLAFITHAPNERQNQPASRLYVVDIASRTYVTTLRIPGTNPIGRGVTSRGGDAMLVAYIDGGMGFIGVLSAMTGEWSSIPFSEGIRDVVLAVPGKRLAVAAGGGFMTILDIDQKTVLKDFEIGGTVRDAAISSDGRRAIFALDVQPGTPGIVVMDLGDKCTAAFEQSLCLGGFDIVQDPSGIALSNDGHTAFLTSRSDKKVLAFDLDNLRATELDNGFPTPVRGAAYSEEIQAVLALQESETAGRVLTFNIPFRTTIALADAAPTLPNPMDIVADPSGKRLVVVAAGTIQPGTGTSTPTAGLSVIEATADPSGKLTVIASTGLYPTDPEDTFMDGVFVGHQRYAPHRVGILSGR